ncbi:hypothetical protein Ais01nite_02650 [Asanoa ishikariensis]|uniref:Uncharacterized protein n=1 Tax=Asanoa ishikariensis TaxID=137265 RepID=A0A1H3TLP4_9ACTN|nr:hypothetical protein [Asanoa ishikariensis]GIF62230.1 hypothetical protein Ais01nite_02650 [Asanoa ishikariensis]SDZ50798.1 hypothetical protein SAMN05421684_5966 [Asanoa ishikariensis]
MPRRREVDPEEREQHLRAYRGAVHQLQQSSYRNLRPAIANLCILVGFIAALSSTTSDDRTASLIVTIVGGLLAGATYFIKSWLLLGVAVVVVAVGVALAVAA